MSAHEIKILRNCVHIIFLFVAHFLCVNKTKLYVYGRQMMRVRFGAYMLKVNCSFPSTGRMRSFTNDKSSQIINFYYQIFYWFNLLRGTKLFRINSLCIRAVQFKHLL